MLSATLGYNHFAGPRTVLSFRVILGIDLIAGGRTTRTFVQCPPEAEMDPSKQSPRTAASRDAKGGS